MSQRVRPTKRVLIIHEETRIRFFLRARLERKGYVVRLAHDAESFRDQIFQEKPHLIVLGSRLGRQLGSEVYEWLLTMGLDRHIPVVYLSGRSEKKPAVPPKPGKAYALYKNPLQTEALAKDIDLFMRA